MTSNATSSQEILRDGITKHYHELCYMISGFFARRAPSIERDEAVCAVLAHMVETVLSTKWVSRFDPERPVLAWLKYYAWMGAISYLRDSARELDHRGPSLDRDEVDFGSDEPDPAVVLEIHEDLDEARRAVGPTAMRMLELSNDGYSFVEIAAMFGVPAGTVYATVSRARTRLVAS